MLDKQIEALDFFKKKDHSKNKKHQLKIFILAVVMSQISFLCHNIGLVKTTIESHKINKQVINSYEKLREAKIKGDQEVIITEFINMKNSQNPMGELLSASLIKENIANEVWENESYKKTEDYKLYGSKITPRTKKILEAIYKTNMNSGLKAQYKRIDALECFIADFSCHIGKPMMQKEMKHSLQQIEVLLNKDNYDIAHPEEFKKWIGYIKNTYAVTLVKLPK